MRRKALYEFCDAHLEKSKEDRIYSVLNVLNIIEKDVKSLRDYLKRRIPSQYVDDIFESALSSLKEDKKQAVEEINSNEFEKICYDGAAQKL